MSVKQIRWLALGALVFILFLGYWASYRNVTIVLNGQAIELSTRAITVSGALKDAGIQWQSDDVIVPNPIGFVSNGDRIVLFRAINYQISVDDRMISIASTNRDPLSLMEEAGIDIGLADAIFQNGIRINLEGSFSFNEFQQLSVRRAFAATVFDGSTPTTTGIVM